MTSYSPRRCRPAGMPSAAMASVTRFNRFGPSIRHTRSMIARWVWTPSAMNPTVIRSSASSAPGRPRSRWPREGMALKRCVPYLAPASNPATASSNVAIEWPVLTTTPRATSVRITSSAPGSSGRHRHQAHAGSATTRHGAAAGDAQVPRVVGALLLRIEEWALRVDAERLRPSKVLRPPAGVTTPARPHLLERGGDDGRQERGDAVPRKPLRPRARWSPDWR